MQSSISVCNARGCRGFPCTKLVTISQLHPQPLAAPVKDPGWEEALQSQARQQLVLITTKKHASLR